MTGVLTNTDSNILGSRGSFSDTGIFLLLLHNDRSRTLKSPGTEQSHITVPTGKEKHGYCNHILKLPEDLRVTPTQTAFLSLGQKG